MGRMKALYMDLLERQVNPYPLSIPSEPLTTSFDEMVWLVTIYDYHLSAIINLGLFSTKALAESASTAYVIENNMSDFEIALDQIPNH